jgi:hypothetical protein
MSERINNCERSQNTARLRNLDHRGDDGHSSAAKLGRKKIQRHLVRPFGVNLVISRARPPGEGMPDTLIIQDLDPITERCHRILDRRLRLGRT